MSSASKSKDFYSMGVISDEDMRSSYSNDHFYAKYEK